MLFIIIIIIGGGIEFEPKCWSHRKCGESETTEHGPRNKTKIKKIDRIFTWLPPLLTGSTMNHHKLLKNDNKNIML